MLYPLLFLITLLGAGGVATYVVVERMGRRARQLGSKAQNEKQIAMGGYPVWKTGDDLLRYPTRLAELEHKLQLSLRAVDEQVDHLHARRDRIAAKDDRSELMGRYEVDAAMLSRRVERMRRVLALVWRTRSVLLLRAHVAITARARPVLERLPEGEIPHGRLGAAAAAYEDAAGRVRRFVIEVEGRMADLHVCLPSPPAAADVSDADRAQVDEEMERARHTYAELENRMDRLADTLSYLSDRCRTRQVVEGTPVSLEAEPGTEGLVDDLNGALGALNDLAELGDRALADTAMDNLAEDISQLERAGLEAQAEADATLEVERLLEQFPQRSRGPAAP